MKDFHFWFEKENEDNIRELIETGAPFFFRFHDDDYHIEGIFDQKGFCQGYAIRKPKYSYIEDIRGMGYNVEYPDADYTGSLEAKSPEEFMRLPFLDGKTIFERFDEIRFFDI
jgi:hypothetical protein